LILADDYLSELAQDRLGGAVKLIDMKLYLGSVIHPVLIL
jgi:hypothetical protein